jgi:hypothetical protein
MKLSVTVLTVIYLILLLGCSRTVIGGYRDSPDGRFRVYGKVYGEYGESFLNETSKRIRISIVSNDGDSNRLLEKEYHVKGSDVSWRAIWDEHNNLKLTIYDFGIGVDSSAANKGAPTNWIATYHYTFDTNTHTFNETRVK